MKTKTHIWVCRSQELSEGEYKQVTAAFRNEPSSVIVFRHKNQCMAYRNLCVHMPRRLDCEKDMIFDDSGQYLRCSMHGIVYDPVTGESISEICRGKKLTPVKIYENEEGVWICDIHVSVLCATDTR